MQKWNIYRLLALPILSIHVNAAAQQTTLLKTSYFSHYPSASTLSYSNEKLYMIGDDATHLLVLNNNHKVVDSVRLFAGHAQRINKDTKADIESSFISQKRNKAFLFLIASFSGPQRNKVLRLPLQQSGAKRNLKHFSTNIKGIDKNNLNIEGATLAGTKILLANRANKTQQNNQLFIFSANSKKGFNAKRFKTLLLQLPPSKDVVGVSGLTYIEEKDLLLFTATTELTNNAYEDGEIGDSYLGYITNFSGRLQQPSIAVEKLLNLTPVLQQKTPQKIESVAVESVDGTKAILHLAADNDNGESMLFKIAFTLPLK